MKKILLLTFVLFPSLAQAIECASPQICTLKASEVCSQQNLKLFGDDECIECGCPDGGKNNGTDTNPICCKDGNRYNAFFKSYPNSLYDPENCACPNGGEKKENKFHEKICCQNYKKWNRVAEEYKDIDIACGCPDDNKVGGLWCCENVPSCSADQGVVIEYPINSMQCKCGCYENNDCNEEWTKESGKIRKVCQSDSTCALPESFSVEGIRVEIEDFNGGKLNQDNITRLVQKIRSDLLATTRNDNVKIVFTGKNANIDMKEKAGFARFDDSEEGKSTIYINSGECEATNDETWTCEGTIVHENIHRVENLNQPGWNSAISALKQIYRSCLSETHAHAEGTRKDIVNALSKCYYRDGSGVKSVCAGTNINSGQCKDCLMLQAHIQGYGQEYVNKEYAKKYFNDPKWFEANNCQGLRAELEEAWLNDVWERTFYYDYNVAWIRRVNLEYTKNDLWIEKAKLAAQLKRTNWTWNNYNASLPEMMAELYNENQKNSLCMSPKKFAMNPNWNAGLEESEFVKFTEAHDFFKTNSACLKNMASIDCANFMKTMECLDSGWRTDCIPVSDFLTDWFYQPVTYTIPGGY